MSLFTSAGAGFLSPVSLHAVPVLGQVAASISASISRVRAALGNVGRGVNVPLPAGMKVGMGCGIAIGYGYGAGVMINESAMTSLLEALKRRVPQELRQKSSKLAKERGSPENLSGWIPSEVESTTPAWQNPDVHALEAKVAKIDRSISHLEEVVAGLKADLEVLKDHSMSSTPGSK